MKYVKKCAVLLFGVFLLAFAGQTKAEAAQALAPFTADQLMAAVNAQCANVTSLRQTIVENVQAVDAASQTSVTLDLSALLEKNRTVSHSVVSMNLSMGAGSTAMSVGASFVESYTALTGNTVTTWQKDPATGAWSVTQAPATYGQLNAANGPLSLGGISAVGAPVTTDGQTYRFSGTVDAALMSDMTDVLKASGIAANGPFPVVVEIDAATLYPKSVVIGMPDLTMSGMRATAVVTAVYDGFNQFESIALPVVNAA